MPKFVECSGGCGKKVDAKETWCDTRAVSTIKSTKGEDVFIDDSLSNLCKPCHDRFNQMTDEQIADYISAGGGWGNMPDGMVWLNPKPSITTPNKGSEMRTKDYIAEGSVWYAEATAAGWAVYEIKEGTTYERKVCSTPQRARQWIRKKLGGKIQETEPRGEVLPSGGAVILQFRPRGVYTG